MSEKDKPGEEPKAMTLAEAIMEEEKRQVPSTKIRAITFDPPLLLTIGIGSARHNRYYPADPAWSDWQASIEQGSVVLSNAIEGRAVEIPRSMCVIEYATCCPRCGTFLKKRNDRCPNPSCTWPTAERRVCPACRSRIPDGKDYCPNIACVYGADPEQATSEEAAPETAKKGAKGR